MTYRNIFLNGVDDLGLDFEYRDLNGIDDLYNDLKQAGNGVGISFEETFEVNNNTMIVRFSFTNSQEEETVEALLDNLLLSC